MPKSLQSQGIKSQAGAISREDAGKDGESKIQDLVNQYSSKAETIFDEKEKDIMKV